MAEAQRADEEVERETCVHDVFDDQDVPVSDLRVEVLEQADAAAAAVRGELEEVELVRAPNRAREIGYEDEARFERSDEQRSGVGVVAFDIAPELGDASSDLLAPEVDLADAVRRYDASSSLYRSARRAMSRL